MRALATWCFTHRRSVLAIWLGVLVLTFAIGKSIGTDYNNNFNLPGTDSTRALHLLQEVAPKASGDVESVVFATSGGRTIDNPTIKNEINATLDKISHVAHVGQIISPFSREGAQQVSNDHTIAFAQVKFDILGQNISTKEAKHFVAVAQSGDTSSLHIAISGQVAESADRVSIGGTGIGILLAGVVLFLVFGSVFAMLLPLLSAVVALGTATSIIGMLTHVMKMPQFSPELVALIGLGVGVDYALFITSRHRQGLLQGMSNEDSIVKSVNTSGRAVLFAGIIVCIALLGMFALGVSFLYGLAIAASIGVAFTMVAALTLLPAMLGFIDHRILSRRQRRTLSSTGPRGVGESSGGFWSRWASFVDRRPSLPAIVAVALVVVIAIPFFSMRLGSSDEGNDPVGTTTRTAYDLLAKGFGPGYNGPLEVVARYDATSQQETLSTLGSTIANKPGVAKVVGPYFLPEKNSTTSGVAEILVYPTTSPQAAATTNLITTLRTSVIPGAIKGSGLTVYVGGLTAIFVDFAHVLSSKLPLFIGLVVLLSFLLLSVVFRSLVIPLLSAAMNLLSIGAAFGVLTAVFQWGWLGNVIGVSRAGPVESFLPVMMFAILFGLSMDYQVFLVTRMHEEWMRTGSNRDAVRLGLAGTGKTITAAAAIMIVVFASFILGGERVIKEFGLGLAGGVFVDAVIIRMAIVPALMNLLGRSNWWFPKSLDRWLPRIGLEHE